jgi:hypothetical protein
MTLRSNMCRESFILKIFESMQEVSGNGKNRVTNKIRQDPRIDL